MSTEEEYKELSEKLRYGLELAEQLVVKGRCVMVVLMEKWCGYLQRNF